MNQNHTEIDLPIPADDIRAWAQRLEVVGHIGSNLLRDGESEYVELNVTDNLHAGVELTFLLGGVPLHTLAIFGEPNERELEIERMQ